MSFYKNTGSITLALRYLYMAFLICVFSFVPSSELTAQTCVSAGSAARPHGGTKKVTVYIESDFAAELRSRTPNPNDATLTETQIRTAILQLAEVWNFQSRGVALVYGGTADFGSGASFCNSVAASSTEKALYIKFDWWASLAGHAMTTREANGGLSTCSNHHHNEIVVWGTTPGGNPKDWFLGSQGENFSNSMLHEFGHALGMGHSDDVNECRSVMAGCSNSSSLPYKLWGGRFPLPWDKKCAADYSGRQLTSRYLGFNSSGTVTSSGVLDTNHEQNSISSGMVMKSTGTSKYASVFHVGPWVNNSKISTAYLGSDGYFPFSHTVPKINDITNSDTSPVIHTFEGVSGDGTRVSFVDDINDSNLDLWYNPPYVQFIRTYNPNMDQYGLLQSDKSYRRCLNYNCSSTTALRSHYPIISTFDPINSNDVVVSLDTASMDGDDGQGNIRVHAGLGPNFAPENYLLDGGDLIANNFPPNTAWTYGGRTDLLPSVACADYSWPSIYNCILVWTDKDVQSSQVLYTYFRTNTIGTAVEWDPAGTKIRGGSSTYSSPAVAFFGGKFFLTWRSFGGSLLTYKTSTPFSWSLANSTTPADDLFGVPSFIHNTGNEAALVYNTSNY